MGIFAASPFPPWNGLALQILLCYAEAKWFVQGESVAELRLFLCTIFWVPEYWKREETLCGATVRSALSPSCLQIVLSWQVPACLIWWCFTGAPCVSPPNYSSLLFVTLYAKLWSLLKHHGTGTKVLVQVQESHSFLWLLPNIQGQNGEVTGKEGKWLLQACS